MLRPPRRLGKKTKTGLPQLTTGIVPLTSTIESPEMLTPRAFKVDEDEVEVVVFD